MKIPALQEVIISGSELERTLHRIMPLANITIDYKPDGSGDTAILCNPSMEVEEKGTAGNGQACLIKIKTVVGTVGVLNVHAARKRRRRAEMWQWVRTIIEAGRWIVIGDFNNVGRQEDCYSPVLRGGELSKWELCVGQADLVDIWPLVLESKGPLFTRQRPSGCA
ncbi:hypothetical protein R1flu_026560 [Riccia fluitans]|uniref:Endonuclease/exonuclease/phosphatase domain-containing protein n=1 Tax=Riccia fluitans TaxID=41844 RepID=A0ABD1XGA2_9MARC